VGSDLARTAEVARAWGYKAYRNGQVVGFVDPTGCLAVRTISRWNPSEDERIQLADLRQQGLRIRAITLEIGRGASTVSRELSLDP
jgi:IS30 family transposase